MAKLYPPVIEGTIPAFNGATLVVPFSMNRAVSKADIGGFSAKIKTVQSNTFVVTLNNGVLRDGYAEFNIEGLWTPKAGQYYKLQLAYIGTDNTVGYYSTVGVVKYCNVPSDAVYIENLNISTKNIFMYDFIGVYDHSADPMEKVFQYRFVLYKNDDIEYDSGWLLHDATKDMTTDTSIDSYTFLDDLEENVDYFIQYKVITVNGLELNTGKYPLIAMPEFSMSFNLTLNATVDDHGFENGYVSIIAQGEINNGIEQIISGKFKIYRCNVRTPRHWEPIFNFVLQQEKPSSFIWKDFTVEHGETYKYKICQYNDSGILTTGAYSNEVYVDFEDMFLFDGKRQLKIRFNPKVSSFKNDILESKLETIGSKYPFFFRNGHVHYKEFPISGLISYLTDNDELFKPLEEMYLDNENLARNSTPSVESLYTKTPNWKQENWGAATEYVYDKHFKTTDLLNYNLAAEKKFKLDVLEWLTDGKPKLFRSPVEGNYIVRLMNTTLTPNDTVGRMLHTFQCTAYEIDDINYNNLNAYGFLNGGNSNDGTNGIDQLLNNDVELRFRTIKLKEIFNQALLDSGLTKAEFLEANEPIEVIIDPNQVETNIVAQAITIEDCEEGDTFTVDGEVITIGSTHFYNLNNLHPIKSVTFKPQDIYIIGEDMTDISKWYTVDSDPQITYSYYSSFTGNTIFDMITDIAINNIPRKQFIGGDISSNTNIIDSLQDIKHKILKYDYIELIKKPVEEIYSIINLSSDAITKGAFFGDGFTANDINKYFSFDKTGWGRGRENKGATTSIKVPNYVNASTSATTADLVKNMPFCIFHVNPTTVQNIEMRQKINALRRGITTWLEQYVIDPDLVNSYLAEPTEEKRDEIIASFYGDTSAVEASLQAYLDATEEYRDGLISTYLTEHAHYVLSNDETVNASTTYYEKVETIEISEDCLKEYYTQVIPEDGSSPKALGLYEYTTEITVDYNQTRNMPYNYDYDKFKYDQDYYLIYDNKIDKFKLYDYDTKVWINTDPQSDEYIDLAETAQSIIYYDIDEIQSLYISNGIICALSYKEIETSYNFENERDIANLKQQYTTAIMQYQQAVKNWTPPIETTDEDTGKITYTRWYPDPADTFSDINAKYSAFIRALDTRIIEWRKETEANEE